MDYILKKNRRSKSMRIIVHPDGRVVVTVPRRCPTLLAQQFVNTKTSWIEERKRLFHIKELERSRQGLPKRLTTSEALAEYTKYKEQARAILQKRVPEINALYGFHYKDITVRNQKTRWGSCSKKGNLNFNYKVAFLSQEMMDYVIVHELCHLAEFNHSTQFWNLVARSVPSYKEIRSQMRGLL
jgi:predicted metal-dependent hydrolase